MARSPWFGDKPVVSKSSTTTVFAGAVFLDRITDTNKFQINSKSGVTLIVIMKQKHIELDQKTRADNQSRVFKYTYCFIHLEISVFSNINL